MKTIPIVDQIKNQEEEKYNLIIETETPTVIEYFKNNLQGKNLNLSDSLSMLIIGLNAIGVADCENRKICIFKESQGIYKHFKKSLKYRLNKAIISFTTFHEIRHILQNEREDLFQDYDLFCIKYLSIMNNKYLLNTDFHDSQYFEIDANIYGASETKKLFQNDNQVSKYIDGILSDHLYEEYTYNFEYFFNKFLKTIKYGFEEGYYNDNTQISNYWNQDGSFKNLTQLMKSNELLKDSKLTTKIVTSNAFLSTINTNNLQPLELEFLNDQLQKSIGYYDEDMNNICDLYFSKKISRVDYQMGVDFLNRQIENKQKFLNKINDTDIKYKTKILKRLTK